MSCYDIEKFDPPPDPDLVCCICQCVLDKAVECPCRHVFCQSCIERWLTNRHTCPTCRKRTLKQDLKPVLPLVQNMLNRLLMICEYRDNGCLEKIMLEHFDRHIKNCGYEMKTCRFSKCGIRILRMHLDEHESNQCEHRETVCEGECGLMIALSDRPTHNCVTALKAHIDEKNRMIEQLKVKLHELNNLSQSLNDQLFELRQQLNYRTHSFSSASSVSSDSSESVFINIDDESRDSFRDSLFDSAASSISADNLGNLDNAASNDANQDHINAAANSNGSDVVEQVERTMENRLFELSSRLERVRNQMRGVLNSRLVHDQNNSDEEVRFPSVAELDALVNGNNNDNYNATASVSALNQANNNTNEYHNRSFERPENRENSNSDTEAFYFTDDENHSNHRYPYANNSQSSIVTEGSQPVNTAGSDVSDLNWISDTDTNHTPDVRSPTLVCSPSYDSYTPFRNENRNRTCNHNNQYVSEHVILSQPPDSPSDTTGSFSSIPSTSSVAFSPLRALGDDDSVHNSTPVTRASNNRSSPYHSDRGFISSDHGLNSPISPSPKSPDSSKNDYNSDHGTTSFTISSPARSVSPLSSSVSSRSSKSDASHFSSDEDYSSPVNRDSPNVDKSGHNSSSTLSSIDSTDSERDDVRNVNISQDDNKVERVGETSHIDSSLDYEHGESHEEVSNVDHSPVTAADDNSQHEDDHDESDASGNHQDNVSAMLDDNVSRCEPDSTQSPSTLHQQNYSSAGNFTGSNQVLISTATESTDSDNSDSLKYLTKRIRRSDRPTDSASNINESTDAGSVVDSGFITGSNSPTDVSQPSNNCKKNPGRKRKHVGNTESEDGKRSRLSGDASRKNSDQKCHSYTSRELYTPSETVSNNMSCNRYGFRKRMYDNDHNLVEDGKKIKGNEVNAQVNSYRSRSSPPRSRQSWREPSQHLRRNRASVNRWNGQSNDNNGQSLNVKIDLSLINYSGHLGNEPASTTIPTATVVHSANISPIPSASTVKRENTLSNSRQNLTEDIRSSTPKQEDTTKRGSHRQRTSRSLRHESLCTTRNTNNNSSPGRGTINLSNTSNRDFPNSWRDNSDSSSDNTWEPGTDCDEMDDSSTEGDNGFETESSYEVQIPKSTAALLDEYASDDSDESWTVGMN